MSLRFLWLLLLPLLITPAYSAESGDLDKDLQALKKEIMQLNRQLFILEEELLYPSSTQLAVFLSVDVGKYFTLDSVEIQIDGEAVTHYLYTVAERAALVRGGTQRLYLGNVRSGEHELTAIFNGIGPNQRPYRRAVSIHFTKETDVKYVELTITDDEAKQQPEFLAKEW